MSKSPYTDQNNTTHVLLEANETWTGSWTFIDSSDGVMAVAKSDVDGVLYMDFFDYSKDKNPPTEQTSPHSSLMYKTYGGFVEPPHGLTVARGWYRARYINGDTAQTSFHVVTRVNVKGPVTAPANIPLALNSDAQTVRIIEEELDIGRGLRRGVSSVNKLGKNSSVSSSVSLSSPAWVIEGVTGAYTGFPVSDLETIAVSSSSSSDASAGTGARTVVLTGLDENWEIKSETVTLNGTTPVNTVNTFRRVHTARVATAGSALFNAGTITLTHSTTTDNVFIKILPGISQSNFCVYTVPAGKIALIIQTNIYIRRGTSAAVDGFLWVRNYNEAPRYRRPFAASQSASFNEKPFSGLRFSEKTDIGLVVTASSANNVSIVGGFDVVLYDV